MKILITGANGTIGSDLVKFFSKIIKFTAFIGHQIRLISL